MPVSTVEPKDPFQVWDFKALSKRGSQEVTRKTPLTSSSVLTCADCSCVASGISAASSHSKASAAGDAKARMESTSVIRVLPKKSKLAGIAASSLQPFPATQRVAALTVNDS